MNPPNGEYPSRADPDVEAADWFARLQSRSIGIAELRKFASWRRDPMNEAAYRRVEEFWEANSDLTQDATIGELVEGAVRRPPASPWWRARGPLIAGFGLLLAALVVAMTWTRASLGRNRTYATVVGERSAAVLEDGSRVQFDTSTEVTAAFSSRERTVRLERGQAFFSVKHDSHRPFVVDLGDGISVTAVGTQFDVRRDRGRVGVALIQGVVEVKRRAALLARLRPGEAVEVPTGSDGSVLPRKAATLTAWRSGRLSFDATPLSDALDEVNRYASSPLVLTKAARGSMPVSGEFEAGNTEAFRIAVNALLGDGTVARAAPAGP